MLFMYPFFTDINSPFKNENYSSEDVNDLAPIHQKIMHPIKEATFRKVEIWNFNLQPVLK